MFLGSLSEDLELILVSVLGLGFASASIFIGLEDGDVFLPLPLRVLFSPTHLFILFIHFSFFGMLR